MDPLKINTYVNELILQHLSVRDILLHSTISKSWHRELGESRTCMRKIKLSLKFWKSTCSKQQQTEEKIDILKHITRHYQHVTIDCRFDKNLSIEFWHLLSYLKNLITLKIKSIKLEDPTKISLPKLQELKLVYVPINIRNILVTSSSSFKRLKLKLVSPLNWMKGNQPLDLVSKNSAKKLIETNEKLEELEIYGGVQYSFFFDEDISEMARFHLKKLKIKSDMRLSLICEKTENNLIQFLKTQSSLQSIFIDVCRPHVIEHIFNKIPSLSSIHIETVMTEFTAKDLKLKLNERIVDLKIPYVNRHDDIQEILSVTPNLESLFVAHLTHETMSFIAWNLQKLTILKYRYDEIDCELMYERLKDCNEDVNQNIEMIVDYEYS